MALPGVAAVNSGTKPAENIQGFKVKEEKPDDDAEINDLAAKIAEQNKVKMAAAAAAAANATQRVAQPGSSGILGYLTKNAKSNSQQAAQSPQTDKVPLDSASQKGKFGWTNLGGEHIPYIQRGDEKYCAVKMVELKLLMKFLNYLNSDIFSCTCIRSYYITEAEAKLLSEINMKHCEMRFGRDTFTTKDLVVTLNDAGEFYDFLELCYNKLMNPLSNTKPRCGFVRINKDSVVPYTVKDGERYVPLFYFEGETEALLKKAATLGPWHLAYLKFCCKIQGIRNELFANENCHVISLENIKNYFPPGTLFDEYWPPKIQSSPLFTIKSNSSRVNQFSWIQAPGTPTPTSSNTQVVKEALESPRIAPQVTMANNGWQSGAQRYQPESGSSPRLQQTNPMINGNSHVTQQASGLRGTNNSIPSSNFNTSGMNSVISHANGMPIINNSIMGQLHMQYSPNNNSNNGQKHPPPLIPVNGSSPRYYMNPQTPQRTSNRMGKTMYEDMAKTMERQARSTNSKHPQAMNDFTSFYQPYVNYEGMVQQPKKTSEKKNDPKSPYQVSNKHKADDGWHKLLPILDSPSKNSHLPPPFKIQKAMVGDKMVPCINAKAHSFSELLVTINDLLAYFFPNVSMDKCKEVLQNVLQLSLFSANASMKAVLFEHKRIKSVNEVVPLLQLKDVMTYMPQLKYVMERSSENAAKRPRISQS